MMQYPNLLDPFLEGTCNYRRMAYIVKGSVLYIHLFLRHSFFYFINIFHWLHSSNNSKSIPLPINAVISVNLQTVKLWYDSLKLSILNNIFDDFSFKVNSKWWKSSTIPVHNIQWQWRSWSLLPNWYIDSFACRLATLHSISLLYSGSSKQCNKQGEFVFQESFKYVATMINRRSN